MTVDQLIVVLSRLSAQGEGAAHVVTMNLTQGAPVERVEMYRHGPTAHPQVWLHDGR